MLTGKRYKLLAPTLAFESVSGTRSTITIPSGAIITVVSLPPDSPRFLDALWEGRTVAIVATDLNRQGKELVDLKTST
jgi:hypothetical protein